MDVELSRLTAFMEQLSACGMGHKAIVARGYDFALLLCRRHAEDVARSDEEISLLTQSYVMDHAADLLKAAVGRGIEKKPAQPRVVKYTPKPGELPSMEVTFERDGKVWEGTLYAVRDIER